MKLLCSPLKQGLLCSRLSCYSNCTFIEHLLKWKYITHSSNFKYKFQYNNVKMFDVLQKYWSPQLMLHHILYYQIPNTNVSIHMEHLNIVSGRDVASFNYFI